MNTLSLIVIMFLVYGFTLLSMRGYAQTYDMKNKANIPNTAGSDVNNEVKEIAPTENTVYVSITGLKLKNSMSILAFFRHAIPSMNQAKKADGNISAEAKKINGIYHTLSVWESEEKMREFIYSGAHLKAIQEFPKIATGKTFGYTTNSLPSWDDVHSLWLDYSIEYGAK